MKRFLVTSILCVVVLMGCSSRKIIDECPTGSRSGAAPHCILSAQCGGTNVGVQLDCSGSDGSCICLENGVVGKTVPYEDAFCSSGDAGDFASLESALESANDACGWKL